MHEIVSMLQELQGKDVMIHVATNNFAIGTREDQLISVDTDEFYIHLLFDASDTIITISFNEIKCINKKEDEIEVVFKNEDKIVFGF